MAKFLGLEIPQREQCLQTLAVLLWWSGLLFSGLGWPAVLLALLFTRLYWVPFLYLAWYVYDWGQQRRGGRRAQWFRRLGVWRHYCSYFPLVLTKTADLDPGKSYIFGCHPHGFMCMSFFGHFATEGSGFSQRFPGIVPHLVALEAQGSFPVHRELFMAAGGTGHSKESLKYILEQEGPGNAVMISLGGAPEMLEAHRGSSTLCMQRRMGFAKLALETGAWLVPVYSFGENDLFSQVANPKGSWLRRIQDKVTKWTSGDFACPVFYGRGLLGFPFGLLPYRLPVHTVGEWASHMQRFD